MALVGVGAVALAGLGLTGCVSTQHKNARAQLVAQRVLDGRRPLRLHGRSRAVRVERVALVRGRRGGALVVRLRNASARPLVDVPIAVGVRTPDGRRAPLNGGRGLDWFATHVPAIGARTSVTWVLTTRRRPPAGRAYALVGAVPASAAHVVGRLPRVAAQADAPTGRAGRSTVRVALVSRSGIPQYGLQVYAVVRDGRRLLAAGRATVRHLGSHAQGRVRVPLVGAPGHHPARVDALPTIFE